MEEIRNIIDKLNEASDAYYNGRSELMTNAEWDALFDLLTKLEAETGIIYPDSPTQKVSEDTGAGNKIVHTYPALSLAKTKDINELIKWANGRKVWMSWKLDGLTLVATYKKAGNKSRLDTLVTRGNGLVGTDVTRLAPYINGIPLELDYPYDMTVRGEAIISYKDFAAINTNEEFANPRNMVAGSLSLLDLNEFQNRRIHFVAFTLVHTEEDITSWGERMDRLESLGFEVVERKECLPEQIASVNEEFSDKAAHNECIYPVDGLVIAYDDTVYASGGSVTGHHATRAGLAFKWADEKVVSTLKYIDWSCATNAITPVAVFEPVNILGTTVQRASLHNVSECKRLGIGGKGTKLSIIKANMIIPQVVDIVEKEGEFEFPSKCPVCGGATSLQISDSGTETLVCSNPDCVAKNISKFTRFVSRNAFDIEGISEATIRTFINKGYIKTFSDIFELPKHAKEISTLEGFGTKSVQNMLKAIEDAKTIDADKFLYSLSIPLCGRDVSKRLMTTYRFDEFIDLLNNTDDPYFLSHIDGIGEEKSKAVYNWYKGNRDIFEALKKFVTIKDITKGDGKCAGYTFVITGEVNRYKNRDELKKYIESQGGKVAGSVSGKTSYLINNDINSTSGKNKKAKSLGIQIITEEDFITLFAQE